jgi:lipopolysaccharide transport system permease protein
MSVFYPVWALPTHFRRLDPLTFVIDPGCNFALLGEIPNWLDPGAALAMGLVISGSGFSWFQKTRKEFADAL